MYRSERWNTTPIRGLIPLDATGGRKVAETASLSGSRAAAGRPHEVQAGTVGASTRTPMIFVTTHSKEVILVNARFAE
jgi:hypothetical protein